MSGRWPPNVYFLGAAGFPDGPVKIGYSRDIAMRMRTFAEWSPFKLEVLASGDGGMKVERVLHRAFASDRLHFEWFRSSQRLRDLIAHTNATRLEIAMRTIGLEYPFPFEPGLVTEASAA